MGEIMAARRFPPPWQVVEHAESFWVQDASGQTIGWFYFRDHPERRAMQACWSATKPGGWP
jgi:hypothetical protein